MFTRLRYLLLLIPSVALAQPYESIWDGTHKLDITSAQAAKVDGSAVTQPVSASSLPLPTGAATSANQTTVIGHVDGIEALLTTIDADTGSIAAEDFATETTLNSILTELGQKTEPANTQLVGDGVGALTVDGTLAATQSGTWDEVGINDSGNLISVDDGGGSLTIDGTVAVSNSFALDASVDGVEGLLTTIDGDTGTIAGAVSGTEMQVDVITLPAIPAGNNNIGDVDVASIATGTNAIGRVGHDTTGIGNGRKTVASAGTAEAIATSTAAKWVCVTAETDNTNPITVGGSGVVGALATRQGTPLSAGDTICLPCDNLNDVYLDVITNGEGATFSYGS